MDGDGEDSPYQIKKMLNVASRNKNFVVTANRKKRKVSNNNFFIQNSPFNNIFIYF